LCVLKSRRLQPKRGPWVRRHSDFFGLIDARLYMPKIWFSKEYEGRWFKCMVSDDIAFQTKNEIDIDLLISAVNSGKFKGKWVASDSAFGHDQKFIDRIPKGLNYFVEVHSDDKFLYKCEILNAMMLWGQAENQGKSKCILHPSE
jgi:SRSO17 transposase